MSAHVSSGNLAKSLTLQLSIETFKSDVIRMAEAFVDDPQGLLHGLYPYLRNLSEDDVDMLGREDVDIAVKRKKAREDVERWEEATEIAGDTLRRILQSLD